MIPPSDPLDDQLVSASDRRQNRDWWQLAVTLGALYTVNPAWSQTACELDCSNKAAVWCHPDDFACAFDYGDCVARYCRAQPGTAPGPHFDPCYIKQNALRPCAKEQPKPVVPVGVDSKVVGTWELMVGTSRWVWEIHQNGTYDFHAEGPGAVTAHSGTFAASAGHYTLSATTMQWNDNGTYRLSGNDTLIVTGQLRTGTWQRVQHQTNKDGAAPALSQTDTHPGAFSGVSANDTLRFNGTWTATLIVQGQSVTVTSIHSTSHYVNRIGDVTIASGQFFAANGRYKTSAPTPDDSGTYRFIDTETVVCTNSAGLVATWTRIAKPLDANAAAGAISGYRPPTVRPGTSLDGTKH